MLELTAVSHLGFGWTPTSEDPTHADSRSSSRSVWVSVARTPVGVEMLVGSAMPVDEDAAPEPILVVADHGDREYRVTADELTGHPALGSTSKAPRLSYVILPPDVGHESGGPWDIQVVLPDKEGEYRTDLEDLENAVGDLTLLLPPAVVHEDAEWVVWHSGVIASPQGSHVVATAARRPGAPAFTDPWPAQPVRTVFMYRDESPPHEESGRTDSVPAFDAYTAMTHTTASAPTALVVILDDPTRNEQTRVRLPLTPP